MKCVCLSGFDKTYSKQKQMMISDDKANSKSITRIGLSFLVYPDLSILDVNINNYIHHKPVTNSQYPSRLSN